MFKIVIAAGEDNKNKPLLKAMVYLAEMERFELSRRVNDLYP